MSRDSALDILAFSVGYRLMDPDARRSLRIAVLRELGDAAPRTPELATLEDEDRLIRGEREPASLYDHHVLRRAAREAVRPPFDEEFWRQQRTDLEGAGFTAFEAVQVIAAVRSSLGDTPTIGDEGDHHGTMEQQAAA